MIVTEEGVTVRSGSPEDCSDFIKLVVLSEPKSYFLELFGDNYLRIISSMFKVKGNTFSYDSTIWAKKANETLGMLLGYSFDDLQKISFGSILSFVTVSRLEFLPSILKIIKLDKSVPKIEEGDFYISNIAVYPKYRGMGIGTKLLKEAERISLNLGCDRLALDVSYENKGAMVFYKRFGFYELSEGKEVDIHGRKFKFIRFVKDLKS